MASRILIVEDDFSIRTLIARFLEEEGYDVACAADGTEGLDALYRASAPDLIVLDIVMPQMNGLDFLREIRRTRHFDAVPVVVISASENLKAIDSSLRVSALVPKPIDADALLRAVAACLGKDS